jgi:hypothetical protein
MSKLKDIFRDHCEKMLYTLHPRKSVIENVNKMIDCGDFSQGGAFGSCPDCGEIKFIPYTCKSRFALLVETGIIKTGLIAYLLN